MKVSPENVFSYNAHMGPEIEHIKLDKKNRYHDKYLIITVYSLLYL